MAAVVVVVAAGLDVELAAEFVTVVRVAATEVVAADLIEPPDWQRSG